MTVYFGIGLRSARAATTTDEEHRLALVALARLSRTMVRDVVAGEVVETDADGTQRAAGRPRALLAKKMERARGSIPYSLLMGIEGLVGAILVRDAVGEGPLVLWPGDDPLLVRPAAELNERLQSLILGAKEGSLEREVWAALGDACCDCEHWRVPLVIGPT